MKLSCFLCSTEYEADNPTCPCPCCHIKQNVNSGDIELYRGLYEAAANMRQRRFNKARHIYLGLTREYPESYYAFFGFCAAKYGIVFERQSNTDGQIRYKAACLCALAESITDAPSFRKACALCPTHSLEQLIRLGELAEESRSAVIKTAGMLPEYDVFLSIQYGEDDRNYDRTADKLYFRLTEQGQRVFFEPQVIPEANDVQAAPFVYRALQTASQMLVYVSGSSDFSGFRVQNAISRYNAMISSGVKEEGSLVVAYSDIDPMNIPAPLRKYPSFELRSGGRRLDAIVEEAPIEEAPIEEVPVEEIPVEETPIEEAPIEETPIEEAPIEETPIEETPIEEAPVEEAPVEETPIEETPVEEIPVEETPIEEAPIEETPIEETPIEETPVEEAPNEKVPVEEIPVEETPIEEAPIEEAPIEEAPVEETPIEETPVEESSSEEVPTEETSIEEAPTEQAPMEEDADNLSALLKESVETATSDEPEIVSENDTQVADQSIPEPTATNQPNPEPKESEAPCNDGSGKSANAVKREPVKRRSRLWKRLSIAAACTVVLGILLAVLQLNGWIFIGNKTIGLNLEKIEGGYTVTGYDGASKRVVIPKIYHGEPVISIDRGAFAGKNIEHLSLPKSLTVYNKGALSGITGLKTLTMHGLDDIVISNTSAERLTAGYLFGDEKYTGATYIEYTCGASMFSAYVPSTLESVTIKSGEITSSMFYGFSMIKEVDLSGTVFMYPYAFRGCTSLESLSLGNDIAGIGAHAFEGNRNLKTVSGGRGLYVIADSAFVGCSALEEISIGKEITTIGAHAFEGCSSLKAITLPESLETIGDYAFSGASSIEKIHFPSGITKCSEGVFMNCKALRSFSGGENLESIGSFFFYECENLTDISYPTSIEFSKIGDYAFFNCAKLTDHAIGAVSYIGEYAYAMTAISGNIVLHKDLEYVGTRAFSSCKNITRVRVEYELDRSVIDASESCAVFESCASITHVDYYASTIGDSWFLNCVGITGVSINAQNVVVEGEAFGFNAGLVEVDGSENIVSLGSHAFTNCYSLVYLNATNTKTIGEMVFSKCKGLEEITLSEALISIDRGAFEECTSISILSIPATVSYVGAYAFEGMKSNQRIVISTPEALRSGWRQEWRYDCNAGISFVND